MASEIVKGLFGFSPQELSQQREQQDYAKALNFAQLNPMQQTSFLGMQGINTAVRGLSGAANQLFGIEDPEVKENALLEQSAKELYGTGVDPMSSQGLTALIQRMNAAGARPQTLERLSGALQQARMNEAKLSTEVARGQAAGREQNPILKLVESGKYTPASIKAFSETGDFSALQFKDDGKEAKRSGFAQQLIDEGLQPGSPEFQARMRDYNLADVQGTKTKGTTSVTITQPAAPSAKKLSEAAGTEIGKAVAGVGSQEDIIRNSKKALELLDKGIYAGPYAQAQQLIAKFSRGAVGDLSKVVNTESFLNSIRNNVIPLLTAFGGNDSNEEKQFLERLVGGDTTLEPAAIRAAIQNGIAKAEANIAKMRVQIQAAEKGESISSTIGNQSDPLGLFSQGKK